MSVRSTIQFFGLGILMILGGCDGDAEEKPSSKSIEESVSGEWRVVASASTDDTCGFSGPSGLAGFSVSSPTDGRLVVGEGGDNPFECDVAEDGSFYCWTVLGPTEAEMRLIWVGRFADNIMEIHSTLIISSKTAGGPCAAGGLIIAVRQDIGTDLEGAVPISEAVSGEWHTVITTEMSNTCGSAFPVTPELISISSDGFTSVVLRRDGSTGKKCNVESSGTFRCSREEMQVGGEIARIDESGKFMGEVAKIERVVSMASESAGGRCEIHFLIVAKRS